MSMLCAGPSKMNKLEKGNLQSGNFQLKIAIEIPTHPSKYSLLYVKFFIHKFSV